MAEKTQPDILDVQDIAVDPRTIKLLDVNAHFMAHETYMRLVHNIQADGVLTSTPLCWYVHDDDSGQQQFHEDGSPLLEVLSGNHRVRASIDAGLATITVKVITHPIPEARRVAIQLSHNSIFGEDDPAILKLLYQGIDDVDMKLYAGLDDKQLNLLDEVSIVSLSEANLQFQNISMTFLPDEKDEIEDLLEQARKSAGGAKAHWITRWSEYDRIMDGLEAVSSSHGIKNVATAMLIVFRIFQRHITDLQSGYLDDDGEAINPKQQVTLDTVLGDYRIPATTAARLQKHIQRLMSQQQVARDARWQVLDVLLDAYEQDN